MMQYEFEELAGYEVSAESYNNIIEPMYMATSLSKAEFVKVINRKAFEVKKVNEPKPVFVSDGTRTPNGCYFIGHWYMQTDLKVSIKTGKATYYLRETTAEEQRRIGWDDYLSGDIDILTTDERKILKIA